MDLQYTTDIYHQMMNWYEEQIPSIRKKRMKDHTSSNESEIKLIRLLHGTSLLFTKIEGFPIFFM